MKYKLTIVIVVSVLIIALCVGESIFLHKTFETFEEKIDEIMLEENYDLQKVTDFATWWHKKSMVLECTIPHLQLTEVTVTIGELKGAVESKDMQSANALLIRLNNYAAEIRHMYKFAIQNII